MDALHALLPSADGSASHIQHLAVFAHSTVTPVRRVSFRVPHRALNRVAPQHLFYRSLRVRLPLALPSLRQLSFFNEDLTSTPYNPMDEWLRMPSMQCVRINGARWTRGAASVWVHADAPFRDASWLQREYFSSRRTLEESVDY